MVGTSTHWTRAAAVLFAMAALMTAGTLGAQRVSAQPAPSQALCWQPLLVDTGAQDLGVVSAAPALTSSGADDVWVSWEEDRPQLWHWNRGRWTSQPLPSRHGFQNMRDLVVAASPSGQVVVVLTADGADETSALHVARLGGLSWEWLGAPLRTGGEPFTRTIRSSIAFMDDDRPVVAWSEEQHGERAQLFVARWSDSNWTLLGGLDPGVVDAYFPLTIAVDRSEQVWLGWMDDSRVRVARWSGSAWMDIDGDGIQRVASAQGRSAGRDLSLAVDSQGRAWVLRMTYTGAGDSQLALARWDGAWTDVAAPARPQGREASVWSASMILRGDSPVIAWSQEDASENHHVFVSALRPDGRWTTLLSGLHLVDGVSNANDVSLVAGAGESLLVAWDEPGEDGRRTRLVRAYACAAGETPAAPPRSIVERETWPATVDQAARRLIHTLSEEAKSRLRATSQDGLIEYHHDLGTHIRNTFGLWRGNRNLLESCGGGKTVGPDDCSMRIMEAAWALLQGPQR